MKSNPPEFDKIPQKTSRFHRQFQAFAAVWHLLHSKELCAPKACRAFVAAGLLLLLQFPNSVFGQCGSNLVEVIQLPSTTRSCSECSDGNFETGGGSSYSDNGPGQTSMTAEFTFPAPLIIRRIDFRISAYGYEYGDDTGYVEIVYYIEWYDGGGWNEVAGSRFAGNWSQYHDAMDRSKDSGHVTLTGLALEGCSRIRAYAYVRSYNNKNSNENGNVRIYEVQAFSEPPSILTQPESQNVRLHERAEFFVTACGTTPLSYQWYFKEEPLTGETHTNLAIPSVSLADQGAYFVTVSNYAGLSMSATANLAVLEPPMITRQPRDTEVPVGGEARFIVAAAGKPPLQFQWLYGEEPLAGRSNAVLILPSVLAEDAGSYSVIISNDVGVVRSSAAQLTVKIPTIDLSVLSDVTLPIGAVAQFYATATNLQPPLTFKLLTDPATSDSIHGLLKIDPVDQNHALFTYRTATNDLQPFNLILVAVSGGAKTATDFGIFPRPVLPDEEDILPPGHDEPDQTSTDYLIKTEYVSTPTSFNGSVRPVRDIMVTAKTLPVRESHPNGLHLYDTNSDIRSLTIEAETVRFESSLTLSNTAVTVKANRIESLVKAPFRATASVQFQTAPQDWLTPAVARMLLGYARDLYLYGYSDETRRILIDLQDQLEGLPLSLDPSAGSQEQRAEMSEIRGEVVTLLSQLSAHRDFFGNLAGHVPLLSFEILATLYDADVERSLRTWWLTYWLKSHIRTLQQKQQALFSAKIALADEIESSSAELASAKMELIELQKQAAELNETLAGLHDALRARYEELQRAAEESARKAKKKNQWRKVLNTVGFVMKAVPVAQPAFGAIGQGLQLVAQVSGDEPVGLATDFNRVLTTIQNPLFIGGVTQILSTAKEVLSGVQSGDWQGVLETLTGSITNVPHALQVIQDAWHQTDSKYTDVQRQLAEVRAAAPELNSPITVDGITAGLIDQIARKTRDLQVTGENITRTITRIGELADTIKRDILAIDAVNRDLSQNNTVLDHRTLVYVNEMEDRAKTRLRYYHYLLAKAYEYRLLKPYNGELDVERIVEKMIVIAQTGNQGAVLDQADFNSLKGVYDDILSEIIKGIIDYLSQNPRTAQLKTYQLSGADLHQLNTNWFLRVNPMEKGVLDLTREDQHIVGFDLTLMGVFDPFKVPNSSMTVEAVHSGVNKLRHGTKDLVFLSTNYLRWSGTYAANDGKIYPEYPSPLAGSLLCSLLQLLNRDCTTNIIPISAPSAWADIYLTKYTSSHIDPSDVTITNLTLQFLIDSAPWTPSLGALEVSASTDSVKPYFTLDRPDQRGRKDGVGRFSRVFSANMSVRVTAPTTYGTWRFVKWIWGRTNTFSGPTLQITVPRSGLSLQAVYVNSDTDEDGLPDWFEEWSTSSLSFGLLDDPDHDGRSLLDDYLAMDQPVLLNIIAEKSGRIEFAVYGAARQVEASSDFVTWHSITNLPPAADSPFLVPGHESPTVIQHRPQPGTGHQFYRAVKMQ